MSDTATQGTGTRASEFDGAQAAATPEELRAQQAALTGAGNGQPVTMQPPATGPVYTEEQLNAAREEAARIERERLHGKVEGIDQIRQELDELKAERQRELDEAAAAVRTAEEAAEAERVEKMTLTQRLEHHTTETDKRFRQMEEEREAERSLFEKERKFNALKEYRDGKLAQIGDAIIPQLRQDIFGEDEASIDAAIQRAVENSQSILDDVRQAQAQVWQGQRGVSTTAPALGPLENQQGTKQLGKTDIDNMSMAEYARNRGQLLQASSRAFRGQG